ncbi:MAG: hypothetical protein ACOQNV_03260 [Mycoplasmoidaceae bacterium]
MAKPSIKLNWTSFKNSYNNFKIATTMAEVTNLLKNFKDDGKRAVALGVLKQRHFTVDKKLDLIMIKLKEIETAQTNDHKLLMKIIKLNNLKTE